MTKKYKLPIYKQIIVDVKKQIYAGEYKVKDILPSENDYCKQYNTTRVTVRQAINELINIGLIKRYHGKGSFVAEPKNALGILSVRGVTAGIGNLNLRTTIVDKPQRCDWPDDFSFEIDEIQRNLGCIYLSRIRTIEGNPVIYEETFLTNYKLDTFIGADLANRSLFSFLKENFQLDIKGGNQKIWSINADQKISTLLLLKKQQPILHMKRRLRTSDSKVEIYSFLYCNTEHYYIQDNF